jgi:hypothetical protein
MYSAKIVNPQGEECYVRATTEYELHRKVEKIVGRIDARKFSVIPLRGGHSLIKGGGWQIILYCSGQ